MGTIIRQKILRKLQKNWLYDTEQFLNLYMLKDTHTDRLQTCWKYRNQQQTQLFKAKRRRTHIISKKIRWIIQKNISNSIARSLMLTSRINTNFGTTSSKNISTTKKDRCGEIVGYSLPPQLPQQELLPYLYWKTQPQQPTNTICSIDGVSKDFCMQVNDYESNSKS